jgi:AcrR family transcriptional regulator
VNDQVLTADRILEAAEDVLRRFGPAKATVVDVARVLKVSHGSVYRHFKSKAALRDAVTERWLGRVSAPLTAVAAEDGPAAARLKRWLDLLISAKQSRALDDPELFATYMKLVEEARDVVTAHVEQLAAGLTQIISDGVRQGEFTVDDPAAAGLAVLHATALFHNPVNVGEWASPTIGEEFEQVWRLLLAGLRA